LPAFPFPDIADPIRDVAAPASPELWLVARPGRSLIPAIRMPPASPFAVSSPGQCAIAHENRAIQYSEAAAIESMSCGVLDSRLRGE
jgi:hypothetical protein